MIKLQLLFTKGGLQHRLSSGRKTIAEHTFIQDESGADPSVEEHLAKILSENTFEEVLVVSALNHFTLMPAGFSNHECGYDLIALNAAVDRDAEELMLSVNRKYGVQFYYTMPKNFYHPIKSSGKKSNFNFSGEKFLDSIQAKAGHAIHINLYHNQCEFFALNGRKILLYNNLDMDSEVDFLYFIMFTLSKINFGLSTTNFFVYGETTHNETFISELRKFVKNLKIVYDNLPDRHLIFS